MFSILIIIIVFVGLSLLVLGHEAGHFLVAKFFGLKIDEFGFGFPPRIFAKKSGETEYSLNWLPFGGFVKIAGENDSSLFEKNEWQAAPKTLSDEAVTKEDKKRYFCFQPAWRRFLITAAGVAVNFLIGWLLLSFIFFAGTPQAVVVTDIQPNSPASSIGLKSGDIIRNYHSSSDFIDFINQHRGEKIAINVQRQGQNLLFRATPRVKTGQNEGALGVVLADAGTPAESLPTSLLDGLKESLAVSKLTIIAFYKVIENLLLHGTLLTGVVGPVGIFAVAEQTGSLGLIYLIQLISLISLNLAVINLIPLPALDGGRIFLILVEKIKGSPVSAKTESLINGLGFVFLVFLIVLVTVRDIARLF